MKLEDSEDTMGSNTSGSICNSGFIPTVVIVKGKRTKRRRIHVPPVSLAVAVDSTSDASSVEVSGCITEEDEDMANCLILLAQGRASDAGVKAEGLAGEDGGGRRNLYECRTCSKSFPSFQALGGHRASHKKPKLAMATAIMAENKKAMGDEDSLQISMNSFPSIKPKIHECSICGLEFNSGQALGGHMRRHRPLTTSTIQEAANKERAFLSLDLNLPAPADDEQDELQRPTSPAFTFALAAPSALVDCHY
ncbi:hypothetical protein B296_00003419 [Ensete ventricosum]|uniref:C2H2-type domain-containing protein n=1 Tax=Ensete ventricosum TaxID=4639 RepID=A0A427AKD2_ENSVE|nr:hypothetical protein B296_00003419 [Ensete ventricosum]